MPSNDSGPAMTRALEALAVPREAFDSALALTAEEVRGFLEAHHDEERDEPTRIAAELGKFASAHIDADRFAGLVLQRQAVDVEILHAAEKGFGGLTALRERGEDLHVVRVPAGADLVQAVRDALAEAGRAFGLTRAIRFVRNGTAQREAPMGDPFPSRLWSTAERALAPPLVVEVDGGDLRVSGLGDLLEGGQKLIILVRGPAPPAPLARLLRPGLLVVQTTELDGLRGVADFEGPAIAAFLPDGAAVFTHDPRRGPDYARRLVVESLPEGDDRGVGSLTAASILEDLAHLRELVSGGATPEVSTSSVNLPVGAVNPDVESAPMSAAPLAPSPDLEGSSSDSAARLAGWLLEQAGL